MNDHERVEARRAAFPDAGVPSPVRAIALLAAAILLAVALAGVNPASAQPTGVRTLTIRAAPDESYRAQPNWEANLRTNVAAVSALYEKAFRIRFVLLDIVPWAAPRGDRLLQTSTLMADVPPGRADLVVAFSGRCEGYMAGWTVLFDQYAVVTSGVCGTAATNQATAQAILAHELAHLFGAFHPASNVESIMRNGPADRFDDQDPPPDPRLRFLARGDEPNSGNATGVERHLRRRPRKRRAYPARAGLPACRGDAAAPGEAAGSRGGSARGHQARRDRGAATRDAGPCLRQHRSPRRSGAKAPDRQGARFSTHGGADKPWVRSPAAREGRGRPFRVSGRAADGPASGTSIYG